MKQFVRTNDEGQRVLSIDEMDMAARANFYEHVERWSQEVHGWESPEVLSEQEARGAIVGIADIALDLLNGEVGESVHIDEETLEYILDTFEQAWRNAAAQMDLLTVMTASEVDEEYDLPEGTAKLTANRGNIPARKSVGTWLIRRSDALKKWGHSVKLFAIAIAIAVIAAHLPA